MSKTFLPPLSTRGYSHKEESGFHGWGLGFRKPNSKSNSLFPLTFKMVGKSSRSVHLVDFLPLSIYTYLSTIYYPNTVDMSHAIFCLQTSMRENKKEDTQNIKEAIVNILAGNTPLEHDSHCYHIQHNPVRMHPVIRRIHL